MLTLLSVPLTGAPRAAFARTFTDVIHKHIELDPLCVSVVDTPEFQRLRGLRQAHHASLSHDSTPCSLPFIRTWKLALAQLGTCAWVFPGAVHDRFQHSLGVAHLAGSWAAHFQRTQPELRISAQDVVCVRLAG